MRKLLVWILAALMALSGFAFAEATNTPVAAVNGGDAARVGSQLYLAIPDGTRQMLLRVPESGDPICIDRADFFDDIIPYGNGIIYLKTENGSSAVMNFDGTYLNTVYAFGTSEAGALSYYDGRLLVLIDGLLHSIEPSSKLCLRMSGAAMLDYVLDGNMAYFLSGGDRMEYTATLEDGQTVSAQAGCIYSLDLTTGETVLLLKNGGRDIQVAGGQLYFHNLADAYAARVTGVPELRGRVRSLDVQARTLGDGCSEPDNGFWALSRLVIWYDGALNMDTEAGTIALYAPDANATVVSDGTNLYVWEPGKQTLTQVTLNGTLSVVYSGDLEKSADLSLMLPSASPTASPTATLGDVNGGTPAWFEGFGPITDATPTPDFGAWTQATPIGATPTPQPTPVLFPTPTPGAGGGSGNSGSGNSGSGNGGTTSGGGTYSVSISYLKITGGTVNVRSGPGTGYAVKGTLSKGAIVKCTGTAAKDSGNNTWYQINYDSAKRWVSAGYAQKTSAPGDDYTGPEESMSGTTVTVTGSSVNVRAKANLSGADLGVAHKGDTFNFKGIKSTDSRGVAWYKITYKGGTGWISSRYSKVSGGGNGGGGSGSASGTLYTTGSVNVRSGPGLDYSSKGTLSRGTAFTVTNKQKDGRGVTWYKGSGGGKSGWVSSAYLSSEKPSSGSGSGSLVTTGELTIRSKPNKTSSALGYIASGKTVTYLNNSDVDSRGVTWYFISYKGTKGWISSKYCRFK